MRVTVRGVVVGGSVGVLLTTVLLWSQCHPPPPHTHHHYQHNPASQNVGKQQQLHRSPLQTKFQSGNGLGGGGGGDESYMEEEYGGGGGGANGDLHNINQQGDGVGREVGPVVAANTRLVEIPCIINHETEISCRRDAQDVYIPFTFIKNYFEVYGRIDQKSDGSDIFEWSHSYSKVYESQGLYSPTGTFLNFELYNVEARERVKCVSATEGVPISTQWQSSGYTYPIQIAQFGLSHYCKHLTEQPPQRFVLEDGVLHKGTWHAEGIGAKVVRALDPISFSNILKFRTPDSYAKGGAVLKIPDSSTQNLIVLNLNIFLQGNASFTVTMEYKYKKTEILTLHYIRSEKLLQVKDHQIFYGLGDQQGWRRITRNLLIDVHKGAAASPQLRKQFKKVSKSKLKVVSISLNGEGTLKNLTLSSAEHLLHFYDAANWLLSHQDKQGGWPIPVPRKVISGILELESGWYSAMAQGQAMSLLVRAAHHSGDSRYLKAAVRATALFSVNATRGGVRTYFPGGSVWYEEYPTNPSLFVLNGFIYSLLGLYDLKEYATGTSNNSGDLFEEGMKSLKKLLPLFDTGWGSLYDLRHFTTHVAPNRARWDYHTTHITQLLLLASIDSDPVLSSTAQRWKDYMVGHRASHN